jgi:hypothetical protein
LNPAADRWAINLWRIKKDHQEMFERFKRQLARKES